MEGVSAPGVPGGCPLKRECALALLAGLRDQLVSPQTCPLVKEEAFLAPAAGSASPVSTVHRAFIFSLGETFHLIGRFWAILTFICALFYEWRNASLPTPMRNKM